jgi:hypothetical protein
MFRVTAKTIAKDTGESTADAEVLSLVRLIEDKITDAMGHHLTEVEMLLPMEFERLKELSVKEAQTLVYGRLLQELDLAGLKAEIMLHPTITTIKVKWRSALGPNLEKEMKKLIISHLPKPQIDKNDRNDRNDKKIPSFK